MPNLNEEYNTILLVSLLCEVAILLRFERTVVALELLDNNVVFVREVLSVRNLYFLCQR